MAPHRTHDIDAILKLYLERHAPTYEVIAERLGCSVVTIKRCIKSFATWEQRRERELNIKHNRG